MLYQSNTTNFIMFVIVLGQHVSILIESSSGPSKKIDPYLATFKMRRGIPNTCKRLRSHSAFQTLLSKDLYLRRARR